MKIVNLSYWHTPALPGHRLLHIDKNIVDNVGLSLILRQIEKFEPDLILEREGNDGRALFPEVYRNFPNIKKAWWWIDAHVNYEKRKEYARNFDYIFLAVSRFVPKAKKDLGHDRVFWLPLCYPGEWLPNLVYDAPRDIEISMIARFHDKWLPGRQRCADHLRETYGSRAVIKTDYANMPNILSRSRVSVNYACDNDLNFRNFEVLAHGAELVTLGVDDLANVTEMGGMVSCFHKLDEMVVAIDRILSGEIRHDAEAARSWLATRHTLAHRYLKMMEIACL